MKLELTTKRVLRAYAEQLGTDYKTLAREARELLARAEETGESFDELFEEMRDRLDDALTFEEIRFVEGPRDGWADGQCSSCGRSNLSGVDMRVCADCYQAHNHPEVADDA